MAETKTASQQVAALAQAVGADVKNILANIGSLSALTTTQKASLVVAINELKAAINSIDLTAIISDTKTASNLTWSSSKINSAINSAVSALVNGAPEALDTLKELADAISTNQDAIGALQTIAAGHVKYDAAQTLTAAQQTQARTNIGAAASSEVGTLSSLATTAKGNLVAAINEVRTTANSGVTKANAAQTTANAAKTAATNAQTAIDDFKSAVGDVSTDYVAAYTAARDGTTS